MSVREFRLGIGADIIELLEDIGELPAPNIYRLSRLMQDNFDVGGFEETLIEIGSRWLPTEGYWRNNIGGVCDVLRKRRKPFGYHRDFSFDKGKRIITGNWLFFDKEQQTGALKQDNNYIATRAEHHNETIDDVQKRWKINIPRLPDINKKAMTYGRAAQKLLDVQESLAP